MIEHFAKVSRTFKFEAAHRLLSHKGKCRFIHGHSYTATVTLRPICTFPTTHPGDMVIDFAFVKSIIGEWIDKMWDHNILLHRDDPLLKLIPEAQESVFNGRVPYVIFCGEPTAEKMADELMSVAKSKFKEYNVINFPPIEVVQVTVQETENCSATCY